METDKISQPIPIVFIHKGDSWYLPYVLRQALLVNNNSHVTLISDVKANSDIEGLQISLISDLYTDLAKEFTQIYKHLSSNSPNYEMFCWLRWFYLLEYMEKNNINQVFYLDSDVLIFTNPNHISHLYPEIKDSCAFLIPKQEHTSYYWCSGGHISYWTQDILRRFCQFTIDTFKRQNLLNMYNQKWNWHVNNKVSGGICDMTTLYLFSREYSDCVINFLSNNREGFFDMNFNASSNFLKNEYELQNNYKKTIFQDNKPLGLRRDKTIIHFHNIHFQGWAKKLIPNYYRGKYFKEKNKHYLDRAIYTLQAPLKTMTKPIFHKIELILKSFY
jgi:hypothetical protein